MRKLLAIPFLGLMMATPVEAKRVAAPTAPVIRAIRADTVVVGKVTAIEKETVEVTVPGENVKQAFKVAVIKVDTVLGGSPDVTHVRVGFFPPPPADPTNPAPPRRGFSPALAEGQSGMFFLTKHPTQPFHVIGPMMPPVDAAAENYKAELEAVKQAMAVLADPARHLKAEKADDRYFAAATLLVKYRTYPDGVAEVDQVKVSAEESQIILKALSDATDWGRPGKFPMAPTLLMNSLALTDKDGWKSPMLRPGVAEDVNKLFKDAFTNWLAGPGKDYRITKMVPKK
jgi:hypothetical protein